MTWVSARYAQLIKLCRARGCSREVAKEVVQEAYVRLLDYQRSAKVKDPESLLRRITLTLAINYFQRELPKALATESIDNPDHRGSLIDSAAGPEQTLAAEQELNGVVSLLSAVSHRTCQIFLAQRSGYSYEEIASAFAVKPRTVEKHVASAMVALQEMMPAAFPVSAESG
jgi:RNA polymerase sigma-70 factor (ECF subfamily)